MQVTIYYSDEDEYLIDLVDEEARRERKSRSAVILSILEEHFERDRRIGEILVDLGQVTPQEVEEALEVQRTMNGNRPLGEILVDKGLVDDEAVKRALTIQARFKAPAPSRREAKG